MIKIVTKKNEKSKKLLQFLTYLIIYLCEITTLEPKPLEPEPHRVVSSFTEMMRLLAAPAPQHCSLQWNIQLQVRRIIASVSMMRIHKSNTGFPLLVMVRCQHRRKSQFFGQVISKTLNKIRHLCAFDADFQSLIEAEGFAVHIIPYKLLCFWCQVDFVAAPSPKAGDGAATKSTWLKLRVL
jgi:hypothetical protein